MAEEVKKITFDVFGKEYEFAGSGPDSVGTEEIKNDSVKMEDLSPNVRGEIAANTQAIATEKTRAESAEQALQNAIAIINGKIPAQATSQNQLADKEFVNSSVSTATADFKGTYNSLEDLEQVTANANDYAFVIATDAAGNTVYKRYKWVDGSGWVWEYDLNNSSFTQAQWAAIQSGITAALVTKLSELPTNAELNQRISTAIATALAAYYTKTEVNALLDTIRQSVTAETNARTDADATLRGLIQQVSTSLANYYLKTETYSRSEVQQLVDNVRQFQYKVVTTLPQPTADTVGWIYLVPGSHTETQNVKEEYITILEGSSYKWEHIGSTNVDLSGYSTTEEMNAAIASALASYYTKTQVDSMVQAINTAIAQKQDTISDLATIRSGAAAGATALQPAALNPYSTTQQVNAAISSAVSAEANARQQADQSLQNAIASEESRAKAAEQANADAIAQLQAVVADIETIAEGYVRVAGSSSPALSYKSYKYHEQGGFGRESVFHLLYPCLVGTKLSGTDAQVGKIKYVLKKFGSQTVDGTAMWEDLDGNFHAIDGTEGDVMICNIEPYFRIKGKHTIEGTEYDVYLVSRVPFTWQGIDAEEVAKNGWSPDYCVSHTDTDGVVRMHSVYNPEWNGSYTAPVGVTGKYVFSTDPDTGDIVETYDAEATLLGGAGGLHSTEISLPDGEQRAMNMNPDTAKTVPFYNHTASGVENMHVLMLAEGGTFDAHNANIMGSGFSSNDAATAAGDWEQAGSGAKNGLRVMDKDGAWKNYPLGGNVRFLFGETSGTRYAANVINTWRSPWHIMEAHRAVSYAVQNDIHELEWFVFEGNKYKYRSVQGFNTPAQGEMTCVVWKLMATQAGSAAVDPTDLATSIAGNRVELLVSTALFHGMTTQVSPSWWTSGLTFTEDENGVYEAYIERDQSQLIKSENGDKDITEQFDFEQHYKHVGTYTKGEGYRKNYTNDALMLPDTDANKTGGGLHTYVGAYNYFTGGNAPAGKKSVRGLRRGNGARASGLSPLCVYAYYAPSASGAHCAFGTCCQIVE